MASRKSINIYIPMYFMAVINCMNIFNSSLIIGTSLSTCSYIGELRNARKFKSEKKTFVVVILILTW